MTLRHALFFALTLTASALQACSEPDPGCRCEGMLSEGPLDLACGESACIGGTAGYLCTGANSVVYEPAACGMAVSDSGLVAMADAGPVGSPDMFAGTGDMAAGTPDMFVETPDLSTETPDMSTVTPDAGGCDMVLRYPDADWDGHGDGTMGELVCPGAGGYVESSDDCDDGDRSIHPGASEACDGIDNDCDTVVDSPDCAAFEGMYTGSYELRAEERAGSWVVNMMHCLGGTHSVTIDLAAPNVLSGTANCSYSGSIVGFSEHQTATLTGIVAPDGSVSGELVHRFGRHVDGHFPFTGMITGGELTIVDTGRYRPGGYGTVSWATEYSLLP